jgi:DHA1 family bicyclomycin/chloramphenicol resistance-like MFS transporter
MSLLMLVFSVSPILAPLAGSLIIEAAGWRGVFWAVTVAALAGLGLLAGSLPETRLPAQRRQQPGRRAARLWPAAARPPLPGPGADRRLRRGRAFYLANSSFVLIDHYGLSPRQYSLAFAANAASFIGISQFTGQLTRRFGLVPPVRAAPCWAMP